MEYWRKSEWKLGLFIAGGIVLFGVLLFTITNLNFFHKGYEIRVLFRFASGVESGAPVRLAGVKVGEVKLVKIIYDPEYETPIVEVDLDIQDNVRIRQDARIIINTLGLLGEKYVEILPGTTEKPLVKHGDILVGHDTVPMAQIADLGYQIAQKLNRTIDALENIFVEERSKNEIKTTVSDIKKISYNLNALIVDTNKLIERINKGEGTLGKLLYDDTLYNELLEFVRDIKRQPWKLLRKPRGAKEVIIGNQGYIYKR